ncbi:MAG: hypothetical protein R3F40_13430 [Candidatus Competibacteraceae bacterium]
MLPELRAGQAIMPRLERDTAVFAATVGRVELMRPAYGWNWRNFRWRPSPEGIGGCGEALLLNLDLERRGRLLRLRRAHQTPQQAG